MDAPRDDEGARRRVALGRLCLICSFPRPVPILPNGWDGCLHFVGEALRSQRGGAVEEVMEPPGRGAEPLPPIVTRGRSLRGHGGVLPVCRQGAEAQDGERGLAQVPQPWGLNTGLPALPVTTGPGWGGGDTSEVSARRMPGWV